MEDWVENQQGTNFSEGFNTNVLIPNPFEIRTFKDWY